MRVSDAFGVILDAPDRVRSAVVATAILAVVGVSVATLVMVGYPRPFFSHHSMDLGDHAKNVAERLLRSSREVRSAMAMEASDPTMRALERAFPPIRAFASSTGDIVAGIDADEDVMGGTALVDQTVDGILGRGSGGELLAAAVALGAVGGSVSTTLTSSRGKDGGENPAGVPKRVQHAVCAIANARYLANRVVPSLRIMFDDRERKMDLVETVRYHVLGDIEAYKSTVKGAFEGVKTANEKAKEEADNLLKRAEDFTDVLMFGEEHFFKSMKKIVKLVPHMLKLIPELLKLIPELLKLIPEVLKMIPGFIDLIKLLLTNLTPILNLVVAIVTVFAASLENIVTLLVLCLKFLEHVLKSFSDEDGQVTLVRGFTTLFRGLIGLALRIPLAVFKAGLQFVIAWAIAIWYPLFVSVGLTLAFVCVLASKLVLAIVDHLSGGTMRFLSRTDQNPEGWWSTPSFERGNKHVRNLVSWRPCARGYTPSATGLFCVRERAKVPAFSPAAQIMRRYVYGRSMWIPYIGRTLPARDAISQDVFSRLKSRDYASGLAGHSRREIRDLVTCLSLCRSEVLRGGAEVDELAHHTGLVGDASASSVVGPVPGHSTRAPDGPRVVMVATVLAVAGIGSKLAFGA